MKKVLIVFGTLLIAFSSLKAQKAEVLYFKANLSCCQAKACNEVENIIKTIIETNFDAKKVVFKEVLIADESNKELVEKHNAKSQTVVVITKKRKSETAVDISDIVRSYSRSKDEEILKNDLIAKITECID